MKIFVSALALALVSQSAHAALNPQLLQQLAQKIVNDVLQNDDMIQSVRGEFNLSHTNLENNIAAVQTVSKSRNLPWAVGVETTAMTNGSYKAVYRASRYGVDAAAVATVHTPVLAAIRYAATESNKQVRPTEPYGPEAKAVLVQLETVQSLAEANRLFKELNQVGRHVLSDELLLARARVVAEENAGWYDPSSGRPPTDCQQQATSQHGEASAFNYEAYRSCVLRRKSELNVLEMTKIVQDTFSVVFDGTSITLTGTDAGGILEASWEINRQSIQKFENRIAKVVITSTSVTALAQAFVGVRKHEFERLEKEFKSGLNRFQAQDADTVADVEKTLRRVLRDVKAFIRNQKPVRN